MVFEAIERLKQQFTDKYVVVTGDRPELSRFRGETGVVRTVNMSGRALVEFNCRNNIGWHDIELDFLRVVDAPLPKPEAEKPAKAATKPAAPAKPAAEKPAAAAPAGKKSTADILAAARAKAAAAAPASKPAEAKAAPASPAAAAVPAKGKLSTADILAAARAKQAAASTAAPVETRPAAQPAPVVQEELEETVAPPAAKASTPQPAKPAPAKAPSGGLPTATADKIAWCREHDAKS